jgi:cell division protein FtsI (penicillin-binding protein 3)
VKTNNIDLKNRLLIVLGFFLLGFMCVLVQAWRLQVVDREVLLNKARQSTIRSYKLSYVRGDIYDRHGEKLATSVAVDSVFADSNSINDMGETAYQLSTALDMDYEELSERMERLKNTAYIKRHLSFEESVVLRSMKLKGVGLKKEYRRDYPNGTLAAHLLGFVGRDGNGLEGLELALEEKLVAEPTSVSVKRDGLGRLIFDSIDQVLQQPKGASVMLTLDMRIQNIAEREIEKAVLETNAVSGMAMVVRPSTGEILASAVYPTFDPNNYAASETSTRRNKVLTDPFEPGSTLKIFTVAAALDDQLIVPEAIIFCENGLYQIDGHVPIRDTGSYGDLSVSQIIEKSSNIGALKIGERLGPVRLHHYLTKFGFGQKTGLSYPAGESAGRLRPPKTWHVIDAANIAFGQGLSVTALQLAMAVSALAYDGELMRPNLVARVVDAEGRIIEQRPRQIVRQVVSPLVARQVMSMMRMAVMKHGTGRRADIAEYPVAGKTGTAQKFLKDTGAYASDKYVASFVGIAPYSNPELCVLVILDEPYPNYHGGVVAAPVFREIMRQSLPILGIPPVEVSDGAEEFAPQWPTLEKAAPGAPGVMVTENSYNRIAINIKNSKGNGSIPALVADSGHGRAELEFDRPLESELTAHLRLAETEGALSQMPDLTGLTMREVLDLLSNYRVALEYYGSGVARYQDPPLGSKVSPGEIARVVFDPVSP